MVDKILKLNVDNYKKQISLEDREWADWHSMNTIVFASLLESGWDWGRNNWKAWNVSDEAMALLRPRLNQKIEDRYYFYELGRIPPAAFAKSLKSKLTAAVEKHGFLYQQAFDGINFNLEEKEVLKRREVNSDYPQALLMPEQEDYLKDAQEEAYEKIFSRAALNGIMDFMERVQEPDELVLKEISTCFSAIFSRLP